MTKKPDNAENKSGSKAARGLRTAAKVLLSLLAAVILLAAFSIVYSMHQNKKITVNSITIPSEKTGGSSLRIVLIGDLHRTKFDASNAALTDLAAGLEPDLIIVAGDMIEEDYTEQEAEELADVFSRLAAAAPVYFAAGNHDLVPLAGNKEFRSNAASTGEVMPLRAALEKTGAVFLECDMRDIEINGIRLRIGGMYGYACRTRFDTDEDWLARSEFLGGFTDTDAFKLMISHKPESFTAKDAFGKYDIDLVLSGHTHNGVINLPFGLGPVLTSDSGFFPKYTRGLYELGDTKLVITGGLAGYGRIPRIFNPPEITAIDVVPAE